MGQSGADPHPMSIARLGEGSGDRPREPQALDAGLGHVALPQCGGAMPEFLWIP